jgi:hypothetical protein
LNPLRHSIHFSSWVSARGADWHVPGAYISKCSAGAHWRPIVGFRDGPRGNPCNLNQLDCPSVTLSYEEVVNINPAQIRTRDGSLADEPAFPQPSASQGPP